MDRNKVTRLQKFFKILKKYRVTLPEEAQLAQWEGIAAMLHCCLWPTVERSKWTASQITLLGSAAYGRVTLAEFYLR